jgi:hypothetical protein
MSIHPLLAQPRARTEAAPAPSTPRATDGPAPDFADRLATAHNDDKRADSEEYAATKARLAASQRAQLQALMLSGAMKFAVTRHDAPDALPMSGQVASLPAVPDAADDTAAMPESLPDPAPDAVMPQSVPALAVDVAVDRANRPALFAPIDRGTELKSLPDSPTTDELANLPAVDVGPSNAATAAAMQLLASLPMPAPVTPITADVADVADAAGDFAAPAPQSSAMPDALRFDGGAVSLPATPDTDLHEDHFDAPATALNTAAAVEGPITSPGVGTIDVTGVQSDVSKLDPSFRAKLERVMERMRREFGHSVTVLETVRSQARQNALFAQGRTTAGPVVTWTKQSKHATGLAADLQVDGQWNNPLGYARLAELAKKEGLRTLGARDPGHVEMPGDSGVSTDTLGNLLGDLQGDAGDAARRMQASAHNENSDAARAGAIARVANVAQVARVATVANVARVSEVARPGERRGSANGAESVSPLAISAPVPAAGASDLSGAMRVVTPAANVNMADRISHLLDLQSAQDARPLSSVLLRMENASGVADQIRIDTRGTSVDAELGLGNAQQAAALTDRIGELRTALERRGLSADAVRVQAPSANRNVDTANFSRSIAPTIELAAMRSASDAQFNNNTARDNSARDQAQQREAFAREQQARHTPRSSSDDARHRSRREQPEDRR